MDKESAAKILGIALECSGKASESVKLAKETCREAEFLIYRKAAARVIAHILVNIVEPIYDEYPELAPKWYVDRG